MKAKYDKPNDDVGDRNPGKTGGLFLRIALVVINGGNRS